MSAIFFHLLFFPSAVSSVCYFFHLLIFPSAFISICYFTVCYFFICLFFRLLFFSSAFFSICYLFPLLLFPSAIFQELIRIIRHAEILIARNVSLKSKFTQDLLEHADAQQELEHFISSILQNSEVAVRGGPMGPAGSVISKLFHAAQRVRNFSTFFFTQGLFCIFRGWVGNEEKLDYSLNAYAKLGENCMIFCKIVRRRHLQTVVDIER